MNAPSYPVQLLVDDQPCLVVGAGPVALRKIQGLLAAGADITVVAPEVIPAITDLPVRVHRRPYQRGEVASYRLAITCTNEPEVNAQVFADATAAGVWANSADDPANCSFILPAVHRQGDLTLSISTAGTSPAVASWIRRRFQAEFDHRYAELLTVVAEVRAEARRFHGTSEVDGWVEALDDDLLALVADGHHEQARSRLRASLGLPVTAHSLTTTEESAA